MEFHFFHKNELSFTWQLPLLIGIIYFIHFYTDWLMSDPEDRDNG